jgi:hypothetical protein
MMVCLIDRDSMLVELCYETLSRSLLDAHMLPVILRIDFGDLSNRANLEDEQNLLRQV